MDVIVADKQVRLDEQHVLGMGGEAVVLGHGAEAIKLYHKPTPQHAQKLKALLALAPALPQSVLAPTALVYNARRTRVLGFAMPAVDNSYTGLASVSHKGWRSRQALTLRQIAQLFCGIHRTLESLHTAGVVVGDLNDANILFSGTDALFLDVDSYQFGGFACPVATEIFLDPRLYGLDLGSQPYFAPETDWYSFAVLLCRGLLMVHPYGGTHPRLKTLVERAQAHSSIFDPGVIYPKVGVPLDFLSDDLAHIFTTIFAKGERTPFPQSALATYIADLHDCPRCGAQYPASRRVCPACNAKAFYKAPTPISAAGLRAVAQIRADAPILALRADADSVIAVAGEAGRLVLYSPNGTRRDLGIWQPGARYSLMRDYLVANPPASSILQLIPLAAGAAFDTTTTFFEREAVFATSANALYRIAGNVLLRGESANGYLIERPVTTVLAGQTWFTVCAGDAGLLGVERIFRDYSWFRTGVQGRYTLSVTALLPDEALIGHTAQGDAQTSLVVRYTRQGGRDAVRLDMCDTHGTLICAQRRFLDAVDVVPARDGLLYAGGTILWPDDTGILQDVVAQNHSSLLAATAPYVNAATRLGLCGPRILAATDNTIYTLERV